MYNGISRFQFGGYGQNPVAYIYKTSAIDDNCHLKGCQLPAGSNGKDVSCLKSSFGLLEERGKPAAERISYLLWIARDATRKRLLQSGYYHSLRRCLRRQVNWDVRETNLDDCTYFVLRSVARGECCFGKVVLDRS